MTSRRSAAIVSLTRIALSRGTLSVFFIGESLLVC